MTIVSTPVAIPMTDDVQKELASLVRLITFARHSAKELNAEFPVYCLELALGAIEQEMLNNANIPFSEFSTMN